MDDSIEQWIARIAGTAIGIQQHLNAGLAADWTRFSDMAHTCPVMLRPWLGRVAPSQSFAASVQISCTAELLERRGSGVGLGFRPLNLSYQLTRSVAFSRAAHVRVDVHQVPPRQRRRPDGSKQTD